MKKYVFVCLLYVLQGCSQHPQTESQPGSAEKSPDGFYTWVDASGQMRTSPHKKDSAQAALVKINPKKDETDKRDGFDESIYYSSEDVDKKLEGARLYAWQSDQGQQIQEVERLPNSYDVEVTTGKEVNPIQQSKIKSKQNSSTQVAGDCCLQLAGLDKYSFEHIANRELKLQEYYQYNEIMKLDIIPIKLESTYEGSIKIVSYIRNNKIALPSVLVLGERFDIIHALEAPFSHYIEETWASHGYMQGQIPIASLEGAKYIVIFPGETKGVLELGDKNIKITNFGSMMIKEDAPSY